MGVISNKISREALKPGDHIYAWRSCYAFSHHGIYVGEGQVIHFTVQDDGDNMFSSSVRSSSVSVPSSSVPVPSSSVRVPGIPCSECEYRPKNGSVIKTCLDDFLAGGEPYLFKYTNSKVYFLAKVRGGVCSLAKPDSPEDTLYRASYLLDNGFGVYDLFKKNCEDFAIYCKTGLLAIPINTSGGSSGQATTIRAALKSAWYFSNFSGMGALSCGMYCNSRLVSDLGYRHDELKAADVKKVDVEKVSPLCKLLEILISGSGLDQLLKLGEENGLL